jgi:hypothetical protein
VDIVLRLAVAEGRPQHRTEGLKAVTDLHLQPKRSKRSVMLSQGHKLTTSLL